MRCKITTVLILVALVGLAGCSKPAAPGSTAAQPQTDEQATLAAAPTADTPHGAVTIFLTAMREGNDELVAGMLTDLARQKTAEMDYEVAPPGSDSAQFSVGHVELLGDDAARVACTWSDLDEEGNRTEQQALWALRRGEVGWRIAGVAPTIFPNEPPLLLDFENPEEMIEKLKWVGDEIARREQAEVMEAETGTRLEAKQQETPQSEIRR